MSKPAVQPSPSEDPSRSRTHFLRDVATFQGKLLLANLCDLTLILLSLVAALFDLTSKDAEEGRRFYTVLRCGRKCQQMTDLYSILPDD